MALSLSCINIRSLPKHFDELRHSPDLLNRDLICITESWLNASHFNSSYAIPGFKLIRKDRGVCSRGGGLAIYVKSHIKFELKDIVISGRAEILVLTVHSCQRDFCLILVYNPPSVATEILDAFDELFKTKVSAKQAIVVGDFNIDWSQESKLKNDFETLMNLHNFKQLITDHTRVFQQSQSTIDLLFCNSEKLVDKHEVLQCDLSDHFAICCTLDLKAPKRPFTYVRKRDFRKFDKTKFFEHAAYIDFHKIEDITCAHRAAELLEQKIENALEQFAPFKTQKLSANKRVHWKSHHVSKLIAQKRLAFKKFISSGCDKSSPNWESYRQLRNKVSNAKRDAKKAAMASVLHNPTLSHWQKIKLFKGDNSDLKAEIPELKIDEVLYTNNCDIAEKLNTYFSNIGVELNKSAQSTIKSEEAPNRSCAKPAFSYHQFSFHQVTNSDVSSILNSLKARKSGGANQIPAFVYQTLEPLILNPLTYIINLSLKCNVFPNVWKQALVIPIHKGGDKQLPGNYRPISLLPVLSKVLEKTMSQQMRDYIEIHDLITSRQFGFRKGASTEQILLQLVDKIRNLLTMPDSKFVTLAALDIKKAFDCVHHHILENKLHNQFNFGPNAVQLIRDYLSHRTQVMRVNGEISSKSKILTGVPQGSVLGPLLFIIFINDIMQINNTYLFADDCLLLTSGTCPVSSTRQMEMLISSASDWYDQNSLVLNAAKTDIMTISSKHIPVLPQLTFKGLSFTQSRKIKYLGVLLDDRLNFKPNIKKIKQKLYPIISNFNRNRKYLNSHLAALWYVGLIRPHLEYCASLSYSSNAHVKEELSKLENRCLKIIQIDQPKTNTRSQFNIPEISLRLKYLYLLTFYKLIHNLVPIIDPKILPQRLNSQTRLASYDGLRLASKPFRFSVAGFGAGLYNELPPNIRNTTSLKAYKALMKTHILDQDLK